jgi:hypothetical protein
MKKTEIVDELNHVKYIDIMSVINDESMIVCFKHIIKRFRYFENVDRLDVEMLDEFNKWVNEEVAIQ